MGDIERDYTVDAKDPMRHDEDNGIDTPEVAVSDNAAYLKKELESRVQTEPELFEWIQKAALDGLWYWDLENIENEWLSPEFKALFGYADHEVPNTSEWWQANIFPEDKELAIQNFQDHVTKGVPYNSIVRYRHKDGSTVWVRCRGKAVFNEQGQPIRMLGAHNDLTQLMQIQEELKKKEDVLDMLCTTALDGFWDWNILTGEMFLSVRWKNALGYAEDELENTYETWKSLLLPEDYSKAIEARQKHMHEGAPYSEVLRYTRKDGTIAHMLAQGVAKKEEHTGEYIRMFGTHTDVSYLEEARAARLANEAKSTFLATMSHEIRTPLNAVLGMSQVLMGTQLTEEQRDCLHTLHNSGKHLLSVINDILDFSQIESGNIKIANNEFNIQTSVRDVVAALQLEATNKDIDLLFDSSVCAGAKFVGDPERVRQVVFNLIGNAVKFCTEGSVTVSLDMEVQDEMMGVVVRVRDTGCGMTPDQQSVIFDDFMQASSEIRHRYGGSGLGLSISKKLVVAMGGHIAVESELGVGSTFSAWLPGFLPEEVHRCVPIGGKVLLYEKEATESSGDDNKEEVERGSVAKAIRAAGRDVSRISSFLELHETISKVPPIEAVAVTTQEVASSKDIQDYLEQNKKGLLLAVGMNIPVNLQQPQFKDRVRTVPPYPTSDEIKENLASYKERKKPPVDAFNLGNPGRDLKLLLAEDNMINVKVMRRLLARFPCKVDVACNGREAVEMALKGTYDLILMDMIMPELDGIDATKLIRQTDEKTPIVALTANATTNDRNSCIEAGMRDFLTKPISLEALCGALSEVAADVIDAEMELEKTIDCPMKLTASPDPMTVLSHSSTPTNRAHLTYLTDDMKMPSPELDASCEGTEESEDSFLSRVLNGSYMGI